MSVRRRLCVRDCGASLVALAIVLTGCTEGDSLEQTSVGADVMAVEMLRCEERIQDDAEVPAGYSVIAGAVALPAGEELGASPMEGRGEGGGLWAKSGLLVMPDVAFSIEVAEPGSGAIGWGTPARFAHMVRSEGCTGGGWIAFPGGYRADGPRCLHLTVHSGDQQETAVVGVGASCNG